MICANCGHPESAHDRDYGIGRWACSAVGFPGRPRDECKCYRFVVRRESA